MHPAASSCIQTQNITNINYVSAAYIKSSPFKPKSTKYHQSRQRYLLSGGTEWPAMIATAGVGSTQQA